MLHLYRLTLFCALAFAQLAAQATPAFPVAVDSFAQPALLGMQLAVRQGAREGTASPAENECVQALTPSAFYGTVESVMQSAFSPDEMADIEAFYSTPVGKKILQAGLLQLYKKAGEPAPDAPPNLSEADSKQALAFASTQAGRKLHIKGVLQSESTRRAFTARIMALLKQCGRE